MAMAMAGRSITQNTNPNSILPLITSINSVLQTLIHPNPNYSQLNQFSLNLNPNLVIEVIKTQTNPQNALNFFKWASNPCPNPNNYFHTFQCYNAIIDVLLSHCLFTTAENILESSNNLGDFMIGKIIKAHGDRGSIRAAIYWLNRAKSIESYRCLFSYNSILGVLVRMNDISSARSIFDEIVKEGVIRPDVSTYTTMIRGYCKLGMIEDAKRMFNGMCCKPSVFTYNTFVAGLCRKGEMKYAREIVDEMIVGKECLPDTVTFTTLIDGYCKQNQLEEAEKCMEEMVRRNCKPNVYTYNAFIYGLCTNGKVEEAKRMMSKMRLNGLKDNVATHTNLLKGLCIVGRSDDAANHLKEMISLGLKPDVKAYSVVIHDYCKLGKPTKGIVLLDEMKSRGMNPHVSCFNSLFRALCDLGEHDRAIRYLKEMPQRGSSPNFISYSTVICKLCSVRGRMRDVEDLVVNMHQKGLLPDTTMYSTMVRGYCQDDDIQMAIGVFREMIEKGIVIHRESFSVFVEKLCGNGKASEVKKLFEEMRKRCPVPDVDSYQSLVNENLCKVWEDLPDYWSSRMNVAGRNNKQIKPSPVEQLV